MVIPHVGVTNNTNKSSRQAAPRITAIFRAASREAVRLLTSASRLEAARTVAAISAASEAFVATNATAAVGVGQAASERASITEAFWAWPTALIVYAGCSIQASARAGSSKGRRSSAGPPPRVKNKQVAGRRQ